MGTEGREEKRMIYLVSVPCHDTPLMGTLYTSMMGAFGDNGEGLREEEGGLTVDDEEGG